MHITHFIPVYSPAWQYGGPVLSVSRLCEGLVRRGVAVRVITTNAGLPDWPKNQLGKTVHERGVEVVRYPVDRQGGIIRSTALEKEISYMLDGTDLLHISAVWQPLGQAVQKAAIRKDIPILHSLRGGLGPYSMRQKWWKKIPYFILREKALLQQAAALHVTSEQEEREVNWLHLKAPCKMLPNPVDFSALEINKDARSEWRKKLEIEPDIALMLVCGRQHHKKGLDLIPRVLRGLESKTEWAVVLVGEDEDGSGKSLIHEFWKAGIRSRLITIPSMPSRELKGIYNAADILLLPSRHENFGNVVVEAMACGCSVLISDRVGIASELRKGAPSEFGAVLPRKSVLWREWLNKWLEEPKRAGARTAHWVKLSYGQEEIADLAISIYEGILEERMLVRDAE